MYLIDTHALIFQMFHAIPQMNAPDGRPTNALFGVVRDLFYLHDEVKADYLWCTFDLPEPTFRDAIYPDYKKHRPPPPDDLVLQVPLVYQVLEAMNLPILAVPGYEADDVMATVAAEAVKRGVEVYICTSDKDCRQLINDHVQLYSMRKRLPFDRKALMADWGITPEQVVDFQTLVGDSVDNVPGVQGVGEKTAAKLLTQFGSLDNLIARVEEVTPPRIKEKIKAAIAANTLETSRKLVRLDNAVPVDLNWEDWKCREWDNPKLLELMQSFGFRRYSETVRNKLKAEGAKRNIDLLALINDGDRRAKKQSSSYNLFAEVDEAEGNTDFPFGANDDWKANYHLVDTATGYAAFLKELRKQKRFAIDLETMGLDPIQDATVGLALSWEAGEGYYIPVRAPDGEKSLDLAEVLESLKPILQDPGIAKVNQNIKFDYLVLRNHGIELRGIVGDPMIAHYLLHAGERTHGLDELTRTFFHHENVSITELIGKGKQQLTMDRVSTRKVCDYAAEDADAAWRLADVLEPDLEKHQLRKLYDDLEIPLIEVLAEMELNGIRLDVPFLNKLSVEMAEQLVSIEREIHEAAGMEFNIASPKQLREVLFDKLRLPVQNRTDLTDEPSTDQESLEKLARLTSKYPQAEVALKIVEHRQVSKLKGTYVDALPLLVKPKTQRIHTSFNQTVAATGRLSSSEPNLQNIPMRTEQGKQIRQAFIPQPGWKLLTADYSQIELRLLAHLCGDEALQTAFAEDRDIHTAVAAEIFKVDLANVKSDQRRVAKTVNFGVIYGMSAFGLGERLNMDRKEAERFINAYFTRYPKVLQYQDNLLKQCRKAGWVQTILGRKRTFDNTAIRASTRYQNRNQAEREAINMEIQGSAADLIKLAMLSIHRRLKNEKRQTRMLLSVHDELVFEVPPAELTEIAAMVRAEMVGAMKLSVPLKVDVAVGDNWLEVEELG
jgi:DNA polymerase-1